MLMLIDKGGNEEDFKANLNTSHVNVNRFITSTSTFSL